MEIKAKKFLSLLSEYRKIEEENKRFRWEGDKKIKVTLRANLKLLPVSIQLWARTKNITGKIKVKL